MAGISASAATAASSVGDSQYLTLYRHIVDSRLEARRQLGRGIEGIPAFMIDDVLGIIYSGFSVGRELRGLTKIHSDLYRTVYDYAAGYITRARLSVDELPIATEFFGPLPPQRFSFRPYDTSVVLGRLPQEVRSQMTYLDCYGNDEGLRAASQCTALQTIDLRNILNNGYISAEVFAAFLRVFADREEGVPEIIFFGRRCYLQLLEALRNIVSPESQPYDFSRIPVHYMKDVREYYINEWSEANTDRDFQRLRTLPLEVRQQIVSLKLSIDTITPHWLNTILEALPNVTEIDLLCVQMNQEILTLLNGTERLREVSLAILPGIRYDRVRADLTIHCVKPGNNLEPFKGSKIIQSTEFRREILEVAQAAFPQPNPDYIDLSGLARYCTKLDDLTFDYGFEERDVRSLLTLPLEIRNNVRFISIKNRASLGILRQDVFPKLEGIFVSPTRDDGITLRELQELLLAHSPNLRKFNISENVIRN